MKRGQLIEYNRNIKKKKNDENEAEETSSRPLFFLKKRPNMR